VLEAGDVAFVYRPRVERPAVLDADDVQRLWVVLAPRRRPLLRRIYVGRNRLPRAERRQRSWGFVDRIAASPAGLLDDLRAETYWTRTRGLRFQPGPRLAASGAYVLARHGAHVHHAHALRARAIAGGLAPEDLGIGEGGDFVATILRRSVADLVPGDRRHAPAEPRLLDRIGAEVVLVAIPTHEKAAFAAALAAVSRPAPVVGALEAAARDAGVT